jgi:hypothetical protein
MSYFVATYFYSISVVAKVKQKKTRQFLAINNGKLLFLYEI